MTRLTVAFDARLPSGRWGPLFHVFRLERRDVVLDWRASAFPALGRSVLDGADVGLFLQPLAGPDTCALTIDSSPMFVAMAAGHRLVAYEELKVADVIDEAFPGAPSLHPDWSAFWTLDGPRGAPARRTDDDVRNAEEGLDVVAEGRAIATVPEWVANSLNHPGVIALPLSDAPPVSTCLLWRKHDDNPVVQALVELATVWASSDERRSNGR